MTNNLSFDMTLLRINIEIYGILLNNDNTLINRTIEYDHITQLMIH